MNFTELIRLRQSVRRYSSKPVSKEVISKCLEAAQLSPSACNSQPWKFIVVDQPDLKNKIAKASAGIARTFNNFVSQAPVILVVVIEKPKFIANIGGRIKDREFPLIDIGIAAEHLCLKATELGLGTCMLGWFDEKNVKNLLGVPDSKRIGLLITLGYPENGYKQRVKIRKGLNEIVCYNSYQ